MFDAQKYMADLFDPAGFSFDEKAIRLFRHQSSFNPVYKDFIRHLHIDPDQINRPEQIPFLPVEFFKSHQLKTGTFHEEAVFRSSGTGGDRSSHYIQSLRVYEKSYLTAFRKFFGEPSEYIILALLPSYTERPDSSLIYMVNGLMRTSAHPENRYCSAEAGLLSRLEDLNRRAGRENRKLLLFGVTFALSQLASQGSAKLDHTTIIETGGMKGRGKEITRAELHDMLNDSLQPYAVCSEYGMTELLSQAYAGTDGLFHCPPTMKVYTRETDDPFAICPKMKQGLIHVIDLVNVHSCAFIATSDLGRLHEDESFEVLGRTDHSDLRGCNLLYA
jgi:hypothetical protein